MAAALLRAKTSARRAALESPGIAAITWSWMVAQEVVRARLALSNKRRERASQDRFARVLKPWPKPLHFWHKPCTVPAQSASSSPAFRRRFERCATVSPQVRQRRASRVGSAAPSGQATERAVDPSAALSGASSAEPQSGTKSGAKPGTVAVGACRETAASTPARRRAEAGDVSESESQPTACSVCRNNLMDSGAGWEESLRAWR